MAERTAFWIPDAIPGREGRYRLAASDAACIGIPGRRAPMGGVTTAAAIDAMERETGKALIWASSQFVSAAPTETDFDVQVEVLGGSERRPQARGTVAFDGRSVAIVSGALGASHPMPVRSFVAMPPVPPPRDCRVLESGGGSGLLGQFERRIAREDEASGRQSLWFRSVTGHRVCAGLLAILADFVAGAHPETRGSVGLDNTLRVVSLRRTEWVLSDIHIEAIGERTFHGGMRLYSEAGELMALTSLTAIRPRPRA